MAGSKHILFVEDDRAISEMYARVLTRRGYEVDFAYTGDDGLEMAEKTAYDLILLDIMMPGRSGIEVLQELRSEGGASAASKVIVLTNLAQDKTSKQALQAQADGYLIKADIVPSQLLEVVQSLV